MSEPQRWSSSSCPNSPDTGLPEGTECPETEPAQERGERLDTGRTIARGGKTSGNVPGATGSDETEADQKREG